MLSKMIPGGGSQGMLVQNVLDIRKGKRFLSFPGPGARVTAGAGLMRTLEASSSQDVADGVKQEGKALRNQPSRPTGEGHNRSAFATLAPGPRSPHPCGAVRCAGGGSDRSGQLPLRPGSDAPSDARPDKRCASVGPFPECCRFPGRSERFSYCQGGHRGCFPVSQA
jgi:hypothetical protein